MTPTDRLAALLHVERINCGIPVAECAVAVHVNDALNLIAAGVTLATTPPDAATDGSSADGGNIAAKVHRHLVDCYRPECWLAVHDCAVYSPTPPDALREALEIIATAPPDPDRDVIGVTARNIARHALRAALREGEA